MFAIYTWYSDQLPVTQKSARVYICSFYHADAIEHSDTLFLLYREGHAYNI